MHIRIREERSKGGDFALYGRSDSARDNISVHVSDVVEYQMELFRGWQEEDDFRSLTTDTDESCKKSICTRIGQTRCTIDLETSFEGGREQPSNLTFA